MNELDRTVGRLLLQRGLATPEALKRCAAVVVERRAAGARAEVLGVLIEMGVLRREDAERVWNEVRGSASTAIGVPAVQPPAPLPAPGPLPTPAPLPQAPPLPQPPPLLQPDSEPFDPTGAFDGLGAPPAADVLGFGPSPFEAPEPFVPPVSPEAATVRGDLRSLGAGPPPASPVPPFAPPPSAAPPASPPPQQEPAPAAAPVEKAGSGRARRPRSARLARKPVSERVGRPTSIGRAPLIVGGAALVSVALFLGVGLVVASKDPPPRTASDRKSPGDPPRPADDTPPTTPGERPVPPPLHREDPTLEADRVAENLLSKASDLAWEQEDYDQSIALLEGFPDHLRGAPVYAEVQRKLQDYRRYAGLRRELDEALAEGRSSGRLKMQIARIEGNKLQEELYRLPCVDRFREQARRLLGDVEYDRIALEATGFDEVGD